MVAEVDETTSAQIHQEPGVEGREGLKRPIDWKLFNVTTIQKLSESGLQMDQWTGARYGSGLAFSEHVQQAALSMGQLNAGCVAFVADGLPTSWQIQMDHFPVPSASWTSITPASIRDVCGTSSFQLTQPQQVR